LKRLPDAERRVLVAELARVEAELEFRRRHATAKLAEPLVLILNPVASNTAPQAL